MTIQFTGKHIDAGNAFKSYITRKIASIVEKYVGPEISGHVRLEKERGRFRTHCSIRLRTGAVVEAHGEAVDAYASADVALERLEKRVRRYKRRLKSHHGTKEAVDSGNEAATPAKQARVAKRADKDGTARDGSGKSGQEAGNEPVIIAETSRAIPELSVSEAAMELDAADGDFLVFRHAANGHLNVVYRRSDGHIGWIDSRPPAARMNGRGSSRVKR